MLRQTHTRLALLVAGGLAALAAAAGLAYARSRTTPVGTGVVVIDTNLAYQNGAAAGTGMVLTPSGEVLTNNHVISGATSIRVVLPGTGRSYAAKVVGYDRTVDVALLQLQGASGLKTISAGNPSQLTVGEAVTALGNAGGIGRFTSATGTVTGLHKAIVASDDSGLSERLTGLIETNAGVQPGDSGGPLFDSSGQVIGMDTAGSQTFSMRLASATDAYAIPIDKAISIAKSIAAGKATATVHVGGTAFLGVEVSTVDSYGNGFGGGYGTTAPAAGGVIVGVVPNGPAAAGGLQPGDVIVSVGGRTVTTPTAITKILLTKKPGDRIAIGYADQTGARSTATVTLGSGPPQ